jgi:ubiquinone biosynthesis protein COQ4
MKKLKYIFGEIRIWLKFFSFVRNPDDTPKIFDMIDLMIKYRGIEYFRGLLDQSYSSASFKEQFERGYIPRFPKKQELAALPAGTLGRELYEDLNKKGLDLDFFPFLDHRHPVKYIIYRAYMIHDMSHLLLDYGTSVEEELALQGFTLAQTHSPISTKLIAGGLINIATTAPLEIFSAFRKISAGFARGEQNVQILAIPFDQHLDWPMEKVREAYGITPRYPQEKQLKSAPRQPELTF